MSIVRALVLALPLALLLTVPAAGQDVINIVRDLDFDEGEAWALKFFTSASLMTSLGPVEKRPAGHLAFGFEAIQIPHLDSEQRTVGFGGFKEEDLNRSPVWGRLRLDLALGYGFNVTLGWAPPIEVDGVEGDLLAIALEKSLLERARWRLGVRAYGQTGEVDGDLTCAAGGVEVFPPGSAENPFGCEAPSNDTVTMDYFGLELVGGYRLSGKRRPALHVGVAVNHLDMEFQVDAMTFGIRDRTLLRADGDTVSFTSGLSFDIGGLGKRQGRLGLELFYSPLEVERRGRDREVDKLLNLRVVYRLTLRDPR